MKTSMMIDAPAETAPNLVGGLGCDEEEGNGRLETGGGEGKVMLEEVWRAEERRE